MAAMVFENIYGWSEGGETNSQKDKKTKRQEVDKLKLTLT